MPVIYAHRILNAHGRSSICAKNFQVWESMYVSNVTYTEDLSQGVERFLSYCMRSHIFILTGTNQMNVNAEFWHHMFNLVRHSLAQFFSSK